MSRLTAPLFALLMVAFLALPAPRAYASALVLPDSCTDCLAVPDACCSAQPNFQFPGAPVFSPDILVSTREAVVNPWVVTIYDLGSPLPPGPEDVDWALMTRYNGPGVGWTRDSLGTVFGLTLDEYGNIFVTHTSVYGADTVGKVFGGGAGAIYRIDGVTGKITTFAVLPNFPDPAFTTPDDMPGLGNITYDCVHKQFFVTNMEDGRIYRIKPVGVNGVTGTVQQVFDPMVPDNGLPGWAPNGERLWAVQIHGDRVFYSVWAEDELNSMPISNSIRSVQLDGTGAILPGTDKHELNLPVMAWMTWTTYPTSNPVSDISFSANGRMLLAERSMSGPTYTSAHRSRVLEYECVNFCWQRTNPFDVGDCCGQINAAGGVDYDRQPYAGPGGAIGRVWATGDALHLSGNYTDTIYGIQGFRPTGGSILNSILIDADGNTSSFDKTFLGDVEKPGCPPPTVGKLCGTKWSDLDHDGVHDGGEPGIGGWPITLAGPGGPYSITTGADGSWCVDNLPPGAYTVTEGMLPGWVPTFPVGGSHATTLAAGQTIGGLDFGNYACAGGGPCATIPKGMSAWWTFDEPAGTTGALDLVHGDGGRNALQLSGATIVPDGAVGGALSFGSPGDHASVPASSATGLDIGMRSFSIDAWVRLQAGVAGARTIAEKRVPVDDGSGGAPGMKGWALYAEGGTIKMEIGAASHRVVCEGPAIPSGEWTHFAVTFDRATGAGMWYRNGSANPAYAFTLPALDATNDADVSFGEASASFGGGRALIGVLDEVEFFPNLAISAATVQSIWASASRGKCRDLLHLPAVTSICQNDSTVTVCFAVTNLSGGPKSYHWSVAGLPAGPGCTVAGPVTFTPSQGTITVPASSSGAPVCITIKRPAGLTAQNATSCFALTLLNDSTGVCQTRNSAIRADNSCWCVKANTSGVVSVAARVLPPGIAGTPVVIGTGFPCDPLGRVLQLRAIARFTDADGDPGAARISINGLPPGEPAVVDVPPGGAGEQATTFFVAWRGEHDIALACDLVIEADTDGDGLFEEMCSVPLRSSWDGAVVAAVPPGADGGTLVAQLRASPNPFFGASSVSFTMPRAGHVDLGVYDVNGRLVRTLQRGTAAAGTHSFDWDGRDPQGRLAPAGVYFVRLDTPGAALRAKLVKLR